jgi:hypothetical protein
MKIRIICLLMFIAFAASAQKLPNVQAASVYAPAVVKIDGKATEWNNEFQAYNNATDVFYTIANNDENLYLIVKAVKPRIIEKIMAVGVTLTINPDGKKNTKADENRVITFPVLSVPDGQFILSAAGIKTLNFTVRTSERASEKPATTKLPDSLIDVTNKLLTTHSKIINITGIKQISDTSISVYNEYKIKTAAAFDSNGSYIYELLMPIKYLGLSKKDTQKLTYNIKLKSRLDDFKKGTIMVYKYNAAGEQIDANQDLDSATDFWGEYTLAK